MHIRAAVHTDADAVTRIYNYYVRETIVTFETTELEVAEMARRIEATVSSGLPWIVVEEGDSSSAMPTRRSGRAGVRIATRSNPRSTWTRR